MSSAGLGDFSCSPCELNDHRGPVLTDHGSCDFPHGWSFECSGLMWAHFICLLLLMCSSGTGRINSCPEPFHSDFVPGGFPAVIGCSGKMLLSRSVFALIMLDIGSSLLRNLSCFVASLFHIFPFLECLWKWFSTSQMNYIIYLSFFFYSPAWFCC